MLDGKLILLTISQLEIKHYGNMLSQYMQKPKVHHMKVDHQQL